jgi:hypothetical protein
MSLISRCWDCVKSCFRRPKKTLIGGPLDGLEVDWQAAIGLAWIADTKSLAVYIKDRHGNYIFEKVLKGRDLRRKKNPEHDSGN